VIGQQGPIKVLKSSILLNRFHSAYLFSGPRGVGKTTSGRIFSKAILCDAPVEGDPCGTCESCILFEKEQHFSYRELDAASYGGKEDMMKLRDDAAFLSLSKKKIILLDESHDISKAGQDALLKQTEECPDHLIYIFCTTEPDKMNNTLRDRCMEFQISRVEFSLLEERLKYICGQEGFKYEEEALQMIAEKSNGHVRNAIGILEEVAYMGDITVDNLKEISHDYDEEISTILVNMGKNLPKIIEIYDAISPYLSETKFYSILLSIVNDAVKLLHGYDKFTERRKMMLMKVQEVHGHALSEFLKYLITRDKFVDKTGLQSDLIILHYKFGANNFVPRQEVRGQDVPQVVEAENGSSQKSPEKPSLTYSEIQRMSISDRCVYLRERRKIKNVESDEESQTVTENWPLVKEDRPGDNVIDDDVYSPEEFSRRLVGGLERNVKSMVNPGT